MPSEFTKFKFSYSEKRDIVTCPHRYELISIRKVPTIDAGVVRRLLVPNVLDLAFSIWVQNSFTGALSEIAVKRFDEYVAENKRSILWKHPMDERECKFKLIEAADNLHSSMQVSGLCGGGARTQVRVKAIIKLSDGEKVTLLGRLDLLCSSQAGDLSIWDLKTTENAKWLDRDQLIFYDFCVSVMEGRKVKRCGFLVPLIDPPIQELAPVGKEEWENLFKQLNFAVETVVSGEYPDLGNESEDCFMCFAKRFCKRYVSPGPAQLVTGSKSLRVGF